MLSIIIGIVVIGLGLIGLGMKWFDGISGLKLLLQGLVAFVPISLILGGFIAIVSGMSSIKDKAGSESASEEKK